MNKNTKLIILLAIFLTSDGVMFFVKPIPQDQAYHNFADKRAFAGLPNSFDVASNLLFVIFGLAGIIEVIKKMREYPSDYVLCAYFIFFVGVFLTGFGSSYYHLEPYNETLLWDRLPMTLAFMAFFSIVVSELISRKAGIALLVPLLVTGLFSVFYWRWTENYAIGDLRLYALVQFMPILLLPFILIMFRPPGPTLRSILALIIFYGLSKIFEFLDYGIFDIGNIVSGHSLKHISAAMGTFFVIGMVKRKEGV